MSERRYPLTYDIRAEDPPLAREEIEAGRGACDAIVLLSLLYPTDGGGGFSMRVLSKDGRTADEVSEAELFNCWARLSKSFAESTTLHPGKRMLAREVWEIWHGAVMARRE